MMTEKELIELVCRIKTQENINQLLQQLFTVLDPLIISVGKNIHVSGFSDDDWKQEAHLALWQAVKKFDPAKTKNFAGFAKMCLKNRAADLIRTALAQKRHPDGGETQFGESEAELLEATKGPDDLTFASDKWQHFLASLTEKEKIAFMAQQGIMSTQQFDQIFGNKVNSANKAYLRAKKKFFIAFVEEQSVFYHDRTKRNDTDNPH